MGAQNPALDTDEATPRPDTLSTLMDLGVDALKLLDLQIQLLQTDLREFIQAARIGTVVLLVGTISMLAALPVAFIGISELLRQWSGWNLETCLLVVSGFVLCCAAIAVAWGARSFARAASPLNRSREEFQANVVWLRSLLHRDGDSRNPPAS